MAAGEYVSVSSQADTEKADLARERGALRVAFWGAVAMGCTAAVGMLFGTVV